MIDLTKAGATQYTDSNGNKSDWDFNVNGETLLVLPKEINDTNVFHTRDAIQNLIEKAYKQGQKFSEGLAQVKIDRILEQGNLQLTALKEENVRLAEALEQHIYAE